MISYDTEIKIYSAEYEAAVKELMADLQRRLVELDEKKVLRMDEDYGKKYLNYLLEDISEKGGRIFVAIKNGRVTGAVVCKIIADGDKERQITSRPVKYGFISDLIVEKEERGKGVGKMLLSAAEEYFAESGCEFVQLEVFAANSAALKTYRNSGYHEDCFILYKPLN